MKLKEKIHDHIFLVYPAISGLK